MCVCVCMLVCVVVVACYYYVAFRFVSFRCLKGRGSFLSFRHSVVLFTSTSTSSSRVEQRALEQARVTVGRNDSVIFGAILCSTTQATLPSCCLARKTTGTIYR